MLVRTEYKGINIDMWKYEGIQRNIKENKRNASEYSGTESIIEETQRNKHEYQGIYGNIEEYRGT